MVGDRIRKLRLQHKLSQKELALKTGVSVATIKNWENDSADPCLENIRTLSSIFNVTWSTRNIVINSCSQRSKRQGGGCLVSRPAAALLLTSPSSALPGPSPQKCP